MFHALEQALQSVDGGTEEWHQHYLAEHRRRYEQDIETIRQHYRSGTVLEVGSLPCHTTFLLDRLGYDVIGIDTDPSRMQQFIDQNGLDVRACDIEVDPLPVPDGSVGFVVFNETFEHLRVDPRFALREMHRVLAHDGVLLLTTPNLYSVRNVARFLTGRGTVNPLEEFRKLETLGHMGHIREYSRREVRAFLEDAGFSVERQRTKAYNKSSTRGVGWVVDLVYKLIPGFRPFQVVIATKKTSL